MPDFFKEGNCIYECKTSPGKMGEGINDSSLGIWINSAKKILKDYKPTGFRYIFPVNRLSENNKRKLEGFKAEFNDIDIQYFDCDKVDNLVKQLKTVNSLPELVKYIEQTRRR
jgi:hypothetical protein